MFLWFIGGAALLVWMIFQSRGVDYRAVALGAVLPLLDVFAGGPWVAHTLLAPTALLLVVMLTTQKRRLLRRRWLGVSIGWFLHLVLDASWASAELFWWPLMGTEFSGGGLAEFDRGGLGLLLEVAGAGAIWVLWRQGELDRPDKRAAFIKDGRLDGPAGG